MKNLFKGKSAQVGDSRVRLYYLKTLRGVKFPTIIFHVILSGIFSYNYRGYTFEKSDYCN